MTPAFVVVSMTPATELFPTAVQSEDVTQEMPPNSTTPAGAFSLVQVTPPFVVVSMTPATKFVPTTTQSKAIAHDTRESVSYWISRPVWSVSVQVTPPSVVATMICGPTATQSTGVAHETASSESLPSELQATHWLVQVAPPFVVVRTRGESSNPKPKGDMM